MDFVEYFLIPPYATNAWGYVVAALLAMSINAMSKGGFGGGLGVVSVPLLLMASRAEAVTAVVVMWLPILIAADIFTVRSYPKQWRPAAIKHLAPGLLVGIVITSVMLRLAFDDKNGSDWLSGVLKLLIAAIAISFVAVKVMPGRTRAVGEPWQPGWAAGTGTGLIGGISTALAHAAGPIATMYLLPQQLEKREFVGTMGRLFFAVNLTKVPIWLAFGLFSWEVVRYSLWLMILTPPFVWIGSWLNHRLTGTWFVRLIYTFLILMAVKLAWDSLRLLW